MLYTVQFNWHVTELLIYSVSRSLPLMIFEILFFKLHEHLSHRKFYYSWRNAYIAPFVKKQDSTLLRLLEVSRAVPYTLSRGAWWILKIWVIPLEKCVAWYALMRSTGHVGSCSFFSVNKRENWKEFFLFSLCAWTFLQLCSYLMHCKHVDIIDILWTHYIIWLKIQCLIYLYWPYILFDTQF